MIYNHRTGKCCMKKKNVDKTFEILLKIFKMIKTVQLCFLNTHVRKRIIYINNSLNIKCLKQSNK